MERNIVQTGFTAELRIDLDRIAADNVRIEGIRDLDADCTVKIVAWHDRKADATIFDAEIGGGRTLVCRRRGRYRAA